jgi:hypothetical protein
MKEKTFSSEKQRQKKIQARKEEISRREHQRIKNGDH